MLYYRKQLKIPARRLRNTMTEAERKLWRHIRRKQLNGIQFYRQKPIGPYIVDFYAPKASLVIEVDGAQHAEPDHAERDAIRDHFLAQQGLSVLRFSNRQVLENLDRVLDCISEKIL